MEGSNKIIELQEELAVALINIAYERNDMPEQCAAVLQKNLELQQHNAEKIIFLPKKNSKKLVCKYPLNKSVKTVFELTDDEETVEEMTSSISQLHEDQLNLLKVIAMINAKKSNISTNEV